ncbi:hypothetical protein [Thermococcus sp.]|uniref:hypothetical protein n=1 Tax=Thermococcus sp. TaxID=35749 RepID=UPI002638F7FD|nr:hypothetical protein [Thermococcus sp.]
MKTVKVVVLILIIAITGLGVNEAVQHYQGGEIYEAANKAYGLLVKGFNVTVQIETVGGKNLTGTLLSVRGSTITVVINGTPMTVGGPEATREEVKARLIKIEHHGRVYLYEVPPMEGSGEKVFSSLIPKGKAYSIRFSGKIYVEGNVSPIAIGRLKYRADYLTYGSLTINQFSSRGAILTANMVPVQYLLSNLKGYRVFVYGILYVNSEERNMPLRVLEVRTG